ncbi:MAG: hypothetical protein NC918_02600 [Candidatus Omnitrophica bacterium]|nr:hypothetical protein [Candidatus Omnitrophota bacterium]
MMLDEVIKSKKNFTKEEIENSLLEIDIAKIFKPLKENKTEKEVDNDEDKKEIQTK